MNSKNLTRINRYIKAGYEVDKYGRLVHEVVFSQAYSDFPKHFYIHHKDGNIKNNTPSNLYASKNRLQLIPLVDEVDLGLDKELNLTQIKNNRSISSLYR